MGRRTCSPAVQLAGVVAVASLLSGCWLQLGNGPEHSYVNGAENELTLENVADLEEDWTSSGVTPRSEPVVSGNRVYVGTSNSVVGGDWEYRAGAAALDATTGAEVWSTDVGAAWAHDAERSNAVAVVVGDEVWVSHGATDGTRCGGGIERLDAATGTPLGTAFVGTTSAAVPFGDKVAFTGRGLAATGSCSPTTPDQLVVVDQASGATLWTAPVTGISLPAVIDGKILVAGQAFDAEGCGAATCDPVWSAAIDDPVRRQGGSAAGHIFVTAGEGFDAARLYALDPANGAVLWSASSTMGEYFDSGIAVADDFVYVTIGGYNTWFRAFPVDGCGAPTCDPSWSAQVEWASQGSPVVAGGVVYVSSEFRLAAFRAAGCGAATCQPLTLLNPGAGGPISVANGRVFMSSGILGGHDRVRTFAPAG